MLARPFRFLGILTARLARAILVPAGIRPPDGAGSGGTVFRHYL